MVVVVVVSLCGRVVVVVVVTSRRGGEEEEKEIQPDRAEAKKMTAISFCNMGGVTSTFELVMLLGAREAIFLSLLQYISPHEQRLSLPPPRRNRAALCCSPPPSRHLALSVSVGGKIAYCAI